MQIFPLRRIVCPPVEGFLEGDAESSRACNVCAPISNLAGASPFASSQLSPTPTQTANPLSGEDQIEIIIVTDRRTGLVAGELQCVWTIVCYFNVNYFNPAFACKPLQSGRERLRLRLDPVCAPTQQRDLTELFTYWLHLINNRPTVTGVQYAKSERVNDATQWTRVHSTLRHAAPTCTPAFESVLVLFGKQQQRCVINK